ncbi:MarR family transcriptional regulator [Planosporangium thailandense]|uniref:MarR family transcriptional regulator n=1 Tax=Planosporangium thailandense TaxID=765197 RepID=A0ABX0XU33_9ACTN|nr:MarR family transcriptional regulator [Planosporangium thailandense]NJC69397.1 MarR family transcriptional regulator [Planosporangium thailandense]
MEPTTSSALQASFALRATIGRLRRRLREVASSDGLTPSQVAVLTRLGKEEASTASALASAEGVRPQSMASILSALEQLGLISRAPDPTDGRRQIVTLTAAGKALDRDNQQARREWLTRAMHERFSEDERQAVIAAMALLERLTDA